MLDNRYQLKEILGSGGMATVWRAHDRILHRTVALKILDQSAATDHALRHRMLDEALAAAAITHPHLVDVYDYGETSGPAGEPLPFVVMEYLTGRTLADPGVLRSLSPGEAITICGQVAGALAALHQHGLVHRDIKPANVMLTPDGARSSTSASPRSPGPPTWTSTEPWWAHRPTWPPSASSAATCRRRPTCTPSAC